MGQHLLLRHLVTLVEAESVTLCCSVKGADPSVHLHSPLVGKLMMLLEGNGFIKVFTPIQVTLLCLKDELVGNSHCSVKFLFKTKQCPSLGSGLD